MSTEKKMAATEAADWRTVDAHLAQYGHPVEATAALRRIRDPEARAEAEKELAEEGKAVAASAAKEKSKAKES